MSATAEILNEMMLAALWGRTSEYAGKYPREWASILTDVKRAQAAGQVVYPE